MKTARRFARLFGLCLALILSMSSAEAMIGSTAAPDLQSFQWIQVPPWLAGTWQAKFQTFYDSTDCATGQRQITEPTNVQISLVRTIGTQQDGLGRIWHYTATPYVRSIETADYSESQTIVQVSVLRSHTDRLTLRTAAKVVRCLKSKQQPYDTFFEITDVNYSPLSDGVIKVEMIIKDFDVTGKPLRVSQSVCVEKRIKPFTVINYDERGNLQNKFKQFQLEQEQRFPPNQN